MRKSLFFNEVAELRPLKKTLKKRGYKKETLTQVFSSEICKIFKNTFFIEHLRWLLLQFV